MEHLTLLYTQAIAGNLALLPRLHTYLQQLKREYDPRALLLDIGGACAADVWHCQATGGQSSVIVLDGMGYHAVNVAEYMSDSRRDSLATRTSLGLVTARHMWRYFVPPVRDEDIIVAGQATPALKLCIIAAAHSTNALEARTLHLQSVERGQVGMVQLDLSAMQITQQATFPMPRTIRPDATIAAAVELVEDEARQAQGRT
ncbi:MAG: hypothetical protein ACFE0Q_01420 [Anaerolineae bacterium]